jgi:hypothetical protein
MYHKGHHRGLRYWPYLLAGVLVVGGTVASVDAARHLFKTHTTLTQSRPIVRHVAGVETAMQHIVKGVVSLDLPVGWQPVAAPATTDGFSWHGTAGRDAAIRLDVYIDRLPPSLAVNRLLPVRSAGDHLDITGEVSEPCNNFTDKTPDSNKTGTASAKWKDVSFMCDLGNYERDAVAIGSTEGINTVTVSGTQAGDHRVLLVYTDNNISPDFSTLTNIVQSFRVT